MFFIFLACQQNIIHIYNYMLDANHQTFCKNIKNGWIGGNPEWQMIHQTLVFINSDIELSYLI